MPASLADVTCQRTELLAWLALPLHEKRANLDLYLDAAPALTLSCPGLAGRLAWACSPVSVTPCENPLSYFHYLSALSPDLSPPARRFFVYNLVAALGAARAERTPSHDGGCGISHLRCALAIVLGQRGGVQCCLKTISRQAHISNSYLSALFNTVAGITYREYVKSVRLSCAAESMLHSGARILEVSSSLGYTEPSNFVRDFRSGFGVCPAKWRESYSDDFLWPGRERMPE